MGGDDAPTLRILGCARRSLFRYDHWHRVYLNRSNMLCYALNPFSPDRGEDYDPAFIFFSSPLSQCLDAAENFFPWDADTSIPVALLFSEIYLAGSFALLRQKETKGGGGTWPARNAGRDVPHGIAARHGAEVSIRRPTPCMRRQQLKSERHVVMAVGINKEHCRFCS